MQFCCKIDAGRRLEIRAYRNVLEQTYSPVVILVTELDLDIACPSFKDAMKQYLYTCIKYPLYFGN